jgi:hypothetical protein
MRTGRSFAALPHGPTFERFSGKPEGDNRDTKICRPVEEKGWLAVFQKAPGFDVTSGLVSGPQR